jgi:hypothetical protein
MTDSETPLRSARQRASGWGWRRLLATACAVLVALPVLLGPFVMGVAEGSMAAAIGGGFEAAVVFWPCLVLVLGFLPYALDPSARLGRRIRRVDTIMLMVLVQLVWWVATAPLLGGASRARAYAAAMRSDLRNLASQQEIYYSDEAAYSAEPSQLAFTNSNGVLVSIEAGRSGWTAASEHEADAELSCTMYWGDATPLPTKGGRVPERPAEILCEPLPAFDGWGPVGDFLRSYHGALERRHIVD